MIYYILLLLLFIPCVIELCRIPKFFKFFLYIFFTSVFILVGGLRFEVGADWYSYQNIFNAIVIEGTRGYIMEPLFVYLNYIVGLLGGNYQVFVFVVTALAISIKFKQFLKYSPYFIASLMIYLSVQFMAYELNGVRQGLAIAVVYLSIDPLLKKNFISYLIIILIASFIHYSALVMLPFYFIANKELKLSVINIFVISSLIVGFFLQDLIKNLINSKFTNSELYIISKIMSYSESEAFGKSASLGFSAVHRLVIFYLFVFNKTKMCISKEFYNILLNAYFISLVIYFILSPIEILAGRLSLYYRVFDVFMIPCFILIGKDIKVKLMIVLLILFYAYWGVRTNLIIPDNGLVPYQLFF